MSLLRLNVNFQRARKVKRRKVIKTKNPGKPCGSSGFRVSFAYRSGGPTRPARLWLETRRGNPCGLQPTGPDLAVKPQPGESPCGTFLLICSTLRVGGDRCVPLRVTSQPCPVPAREPTRRAPLRAAFPGGSATPVSLNGAYPCGPLPTSPTSGEELDW